MNEQLRDFLIRWFTIGTIVLVVGAGAYSIYPLYLQGEGLKAKSRELDRLIEAKHHEIARLEDYQRRFKTDPDFVESIARENRRVFPGELVFIFED